MERGTFLEGQKHGVWTGFFEDESIQWRGSYNEGKPEGLWEEYYHSPYHMKKMKNYHNGYYHGTQMSWYPGGQLHSILHYVMGRLEGEVQIFDLDRNLKFHGFYEGGQCVGVKVDTPASSIGKSPLGENGDLSVL